MCRPSDRSDETYTGRVCELTSEILRTDPLKTEETDRQTPDRCFTFTAIPASASEIRLKLHVFDFL